MQQTQSRLKARSRSPASCHREILSAICSRTPTLTSKASIRHTQTSANYSSGECGRRKAARTKNPRRIINAAALTISAQPPRRPVCTKTTPKRKAAAAISTQTAANRQFPRGFAFSDSQMSAIAFSFRDRIMDKITTLSNKADEIAISATSEPVIFDRPHSSEGLDRAKLRLRRKAR